MRVSSTPDGIVKSYHSTKSDTQMCRVNYRQLREYTLEKLKEWKDLMNLEKARYTKVIFKDNDNDKYCNTIK